MRTDRKESDSLAKRIRELRKAAGMTQAQLAGKHMTRNMVSLIESGKATPSLENLSAIAEVLGVSAGFLLSTDSEISRYQKQSDMKLVRELYLKQNWSAIAELLSGHTQPDDECALLLCECFLNIGKQRYVEQKPWEARDAFNQALWFSKRTAYNTELFCDEIAFYQYLLDELLYGSGNGKIPALSDLTEKEVLFRFLLVDASADALINRDVYSQLISAKKCADAKQYTDACRILETCLKDSTVQADMRLRLFVYETLERCSYAKADYKAAYQYAAEKNQLLNHAR